MSRIKFQLRYGQWPDSPTALHQPAELTVAARRMAMGAREELARLGVAVMLDEAKRAHFRSVRVPPAERLMIERQGDLIETYLVERVKQEFGG